MADDIEVHFDTRRGELRLTCGDEAFARLRGAVVAEAGVLEDVIGSGAAAVQHIEIEATNTTGRMSGLPDYARRAGCLAVGVAVVFMSGVGVVTVVGWLH